SRCWSRPIADALGGAGAAARSRGPTAERRAPTGSGPGSRLFRLRFAADFVDHSTTLLGQLHPSFSDGQERPERFTLIGGDPVGDGLVGCPGGGAAAATRHDQLAFRRARIPWMRAFAWSVRLRDAAASNSSASAASFNASCRSR